MKDKILQRRLSDFVLWFGKANRRLLAVDVFCLFVSVYVGYSMRLSIFIPDDFITPFYVAAGLFSSCICVSLYIGKIYALVWSRASIEEYARLLKYYSWGLLGFLIIRNILSYLVIPRSSILIFSLLGIFALTGSRALLRLALVSRYSGERGGERALLVGAGDAGAVIARDIQRHPGQIEAIGFIDDDPKLQEMSVASLPVLGTREDLPAIVRKNLIDTVLITIPSASGEKIRAYMDTLAGLNVKVRVLPSLINLADGQVNVSRLRSVKLEDLLRREPVKIDTENISSIINGKCVMVTGAGGSIGSEICRQVLRYDPSRLIALGHGEHSIYLLLESLAEAGIKTSVTPVIADVADHEAIKAVFDAYSPQIIFHAGAHKHVPLMEQNPKEALRVNALGTYNMANLAGEYGAERFVMISTDKAVRPTSVMGATKRIAERLLLGVQNDYPNTRFMAVRFGNVLGSRGSVVPKFEHQIAAGGPVTVTDPEMIRYFMLIPEAVSLVLQAGAMGEGGELFVLDMGEPVKIAEMAETLIRLHGYEPGRDIKIEYTGIRPGEKLYEELFYDMAHVDKTAHNKIFRTKLTQEKTSILPTVKEIVYNEQINGVNQHQKIKEAILALGCDAGKQSEG